VSLNLQQIPTSKIMKDHEGVFSHVFPTEMGSCRPGTSRFQPFQPHAPGAGLPGRAEEADSEGGTSDGLQSKLCPAQCRRQHIFVGETWERVPHGCPKSQEK
jgi:hypothetical protein